MFRNYLVIAFRNILKSKSHALINIFGLAIGLACTILILLWIQRELSVDKFHTHVDRIYGVLENQTYAGRDIFTVRATPGPMTPAIKENFPEVEKATRLTWGDIYLFRVGDKSVYEEGLHVDPDFLGMFSFPLLHGDANSALAQPRSVVITRETAMKYFDKENAVGETIQLNNKEDYQVTGVLADIPENSTLDFNFLLPIQEFIDNNEWTQTWNSNGLRCYIMLANGVPASNFESKFKDFVQKNSNQQNVTLFLQNYGDQYLRSDFKNGVYAGGGRITYVRLFAIIAGFILLIACINFMNLSTARSTNRAREVGIRRVTGANRGMLISQFLGESLLLTFIACLLGLAIVFFVLPPFNELFGVELSLDVANPQLWLGLAGIIVITGLLAGSYPAFFMSGFRPVEVLKGVIKTGAGAVWLRKSMVVTQFAIAIFLVVGTMVVYQQMNYIRNKNLGYKKENLVYISANGDVPQKYDVIKQSLLQVPGVEAVSSAGGQFFSWGSNSSNFRWEGKDPNESILFQHISSGFDFLKTIGAELVDGRDFSTAFPADSSNFIINQKAAQLMGMENPVGQRLQWGDQNGEIIGVVKDFPVTSLHNAQDPVILFLSSYSNLVYVRVNSDQISSTMAQIEQTFKTHNPAYPFEYHFVDEEYDQMYRSEQRVGALSRIFAFLSIFVSCLGLFGLAAFTAEQRVKEIGIRKVLGASVPNLVTLLSKDFLLLVLVSTIVAFPVAWYIMNNWLARFAYRIDLNWQLFVLAGLMALLIALFTVSFQAIKASLANPIQSLRSE